MAMYFVIWSSTITSAESASQISASGLGCIECRSTTSRRIVGLLEPASIFAGAFDVRHATPADLRMHRIRADIGAILPAADALRVVGLAHGDRRNVPVFLHRIDQRGLRR